ncbi:hypothetical protein [Neolewinella persica]|uniref:hypothetical protein n=1 Tax=Neolewinella persica TaxID=70998 RepID=UPI00036BF063|nr:hypothetical protein [Neolewinella persica]
MTQNGKIQNLIIEGKTEEALDLLDAYVLEQSPNYCEEVVLLKSQMGYFVRDQLRGLKVEPTELNRINAAILEISGRIDTRNDHSKTDSEKQDLENSNLRVLVWNLDSIIQVNTDNISRSIIFSVVLLLLSVALFTVIFFVLNNSDILIRMIVSIISLMPAILGAIPVKDVNQKLDIVKLCKRYRQRIEMMLTDSTLQSGAYFEDIKRIKTLVNKMQESRIAGI